MIARIAICGGVAPPFDYWVPAGLAVTPGSVVRVTLNRRAAIGVVVALDAAAAVAPDKLHALDEVAIRMRLASYEQNRITMAFEYFRVGDGGEELAACGEQQVACMIREGDRMTPAPIPRELREALRAFDASAL